MSDSLLWRLRTHCRRLFIRDLNIHCSIGVYEHEHKALQPVLLNCDVWILTHTQQSVDDSLDDVLDYTLLVQTIKTQALAGHTELQETLVDNIATKLLSYPQIVMLRLSTEKPHAYEEARGIGVEIWREGLAFNRLP